MRIVHFITSFEQGGAQAVLYDLVTNFKKQNYEQAIVFMHDGPFHERFKATGIEVHQLQGFVFSYDPIALYRLVTLLKKMKPDYLHTLLWSANWMGRIGARLLGIRCVISLHNNYDQNGWVRRILDHCVSYQAHAIVAVSDEVKESFQYYFSHTAVTVILNGVDTAAIQLAARMQKVTRADLQLLDSDFVIGTVGRFAPVKQYPLLLESFALVHARASHARLVIVGQGEQEQELRAYAKQLHIDSFIRWVVGQQAYGYYPLFDCFVLASSKEGISIALLEAMSLGVVPIHAYHSMQHPVIVDGTDGRVAKAKNATDLAAKMHECTIALDHRCVLASNAQQTVRDRFAINSMIAAYNRAFQAIQM